MNGGSHGTREALAQSIRRATRLQRARLPGKLFHSQAECASKMQVKQPRPCCVTSLRKERKSRRTVRLRAVPLHPPRSQPRAALNCTCRAAMGHPGLKTEGSSGFMVLVRLVWHGSSEGNDAPVMTNSTFFPVNYPIRIRKQINVTIQDTNIKYFGGQRPELHYLIGLVTTTQPRL